MLHFWLCIKINKSFQMEESYLWTTSVRSRHGNVFDTCDLWMWGEQQKNETREWKTTYSKQSLGPQTKEVSRLELPSGCQRLLKDFKQEIFFFIIISWFTLCVQLAKQSTEMSNILLSTVCPTQMTIVSGPPRSMNLPDDGSAPSSQSFQLLKEDSFLPLSLKVLALH